MALRLTNAGTVILLVAVLILQGRAASFLLGCSLVGDQAKHFTSGVMVFDYLHTGLGSSPMRFAEGFEVRYPLVSIGHWPPMYYAVQAVFYLLAGPSIRSAQILSAWTAAGLALLIFWSLKSHVGTRIALIAAACFLATPLMQTAAWQVMSDLLTGAFIFLGLLAFANLLDNPGNWKAAAAFAFCAVAAILTKGSAWALGPFFLMAPLLARRLRFFRTPWFWGALLAVVLLGSSFYLVAARTGMGYPTRLSYYLTVGLGHRFATLMQVVEFAPALLLGICVLGAMEALHTRWRRGEASACTMLACTTPAFTTTPAWTTLSLVAAAWIASQLIFLFVLPMTFEPRVLLPSLAPAALLVARFLAWLQGRLRGAWPRIPALAAMSPVILGAILLTADGAAPLERFDGYHEAAHAMAFPANGALILVATNNEAGEAELIAERLSQNRAHNDVILRGSHVLAEIDAIGTDRPRFETAEAVRTYLLQLPVRYIVVSKPPYDFSFQTLLESAASGDPKDFQRIAEVPIFEKPGGQVGELYVYENPAGRDRHPSLVQTPLGYDGGRRVLEYRWK